ncbi:fatty acid elongase 3-ketoacyl-CoA synthase 1 [Coccomyxa subellipsoidea C-169]|uniref:Fatty acid elongase 3-ketoacyl-CoA synthase 1 n=1 Tax=Coccomyxa subellipsoidea (strain C-169) TaxID=574566 RepID=I0YV27_COCSC|nr:fatty acid elongase 3-ketoacyl-CoA synthase 1 [Coccomyxa subellipsoidea C-169]EIE22246.1 fatty acid elongase 3-ketoacyl-CoA synthase 1 [Coccomyxa subellipsoidea C-169]|eukprot:XP_005646790.1 fatty acid elongase 3-ketoacyl-CoA synthase 1 [Coccomyxa subellipsoidea C-169]
MFVILDQGPAVAVLVLATICLGTFPVAFNWADLHGRKPAHTFLDFSAAFVLAALPCAISLSTSGPRIPIMPGLWEQMTQQNDFVVFCACAAGFFLMLGSMSLQFGMALTGMAICLPFQIAVSLSVGVGIDWFMDQRLGKAAWVFPGLTCFSIATMFGTLAHVERLKGLKHRKDKHAVSKLVGLEDVMGQPLAEGMMKSVELSPTSSTGDPGVGPPTKRRTLHERAASDPDVILDLESPAKASRRTSSLRPLGAQVMQDTNAFAQEEPSTPKHTPMRVQYMQRGINIDGSKPLTGLIVLTIGGFCFGMLTPLFFIATSALPTTDHWRILPEGVPPLTVYNAYFFMALTFGFTAWGLNLALLYVPLCNGKESCLTEYARDHRGRIVSVAAGLACGVGMACQFLGGLAGGYRVAEVVKMYPLLTVAWGLLLFTEFRGSGKRAAYLLGAMCATYVLGVGLLAAARNNPVVD